jgi:hypothetical protein
MGGFETPGGGGAPGLPTLPTPPIVGGGGCGASTSSVQTTLGSAVVYTGATLGYANSFASGLFNALKAALSAIVNQVAAFLHYIAQTWLGQILKSMWATLKQIFAALQKEITSIVKLLQQYEKLVRYYEQKILGPIINLLQALRKTLVIFRLFHLKFATQLDNYLSGIEGRLTNIFLWYQKELNYIIDALDFIVDPFGLISEALFVQSAARSIGAIWAGVMGYPQSGITTAQSTAAAARTQFYTSKSQQTYMKGLAAGGTNPDDAAIIAAQRQSFAELGYKV